MREVDMGGLTTAERRQVFLAQVQARQAVLARTAAAPTVARERARGGRSLQRLLAAAFILTLGTGGVAAYTVLEFHPPKSLAEAFMPRVDVPAE
jgi:hypothetical protein